MRLPAAPTATKLKLGIASAWTLLLATAVLMRFIFDLMASYTYEPADFDYPLYYAALATCFAALLIILPCLRVARRLEKTPAPLPAAWQALAYTHVIANLLLAFFLIFATG